MSARECVRRACARDMDRIHLVLQEILSRIKVTGMNTFFLS